MPAVSNRRLRNQAEVAANVMAFGAVPDGETVSNGAATSGSTTVTSASGLFTDRDVGKVLYIAGAGAAGVPLVTTISSVTSSTSVVVADAASTTVSGKELTWGTDSTAAIDAALAALTPQIIGGRSMGGGVAYFPAGTGSYITRGGHTIQWNTRVVGATAQATSIVHIGSGTCFTHGPDTTIKNYQRSGLQDLTLWGSANTEACGVKITGMMWSFQIDRCVVGNYSAGVGLWLDNDTATDFAEGVTLMDFSSRYNLTGIRLTRTSGDESFGYQRWLNFDIHVPASGIGIDFGSTTSTGRLFIYNGRFAGNIWLEGNSATGIRVGQYGDVQPSCEFHVTGENIGTLSSTKWLSITSGGSFAPHGVLDFLNGAAPMDVASATAWKPAHRDDEAVNGQGLFAETFQSSNAQGATAPSTGVIVSGLVQLRRGEVVTNIVTKVSSNGSTLSLAKVGIANTSGTVLASSADAAASFTSGTTPRAQSVALSSAYTVPSDGAYYLQAVFVGTTAPTLVRGVNLAAACVSPGSGVLPFGQSSSGKTDLTTSAVTAASVSYWFGVS